METNVVIATKAAMMNKTDASKPDTAIRDLLAMNLAVAARHVRFTVDGGLMVGL